MNLAPRGSRVFLDTNVFVYADQAHEPFKQTRAMALIEEHLRLRSGVVSIQVLQEYFAAAVKKIHLEPALAKRKIAIYAKLQVVEPKINSVLGAIDLLRMHHLSFWDASILQSARESGCGVLLTEDMSHGQVIEGVRILNPFI